MSNSVTIKSNKHGLTVVLDENQTFDNLKAQVEEKFKKSSAFFGSSSMALAIEGKNVTVGQSREIVEIIESVTDLDIVCLIDEDAKKDERFESAILSHMNKEKENLDNGLFYKGTLRSGQILESEASVVILGDINPGGKVISKGSVVVLGSLRGNVFAGVNGDEHSFVVALEMKPIQIKISDVIARSSDSAPVNKKNKNLEPKIAFVEDGNIYIESLSADVIEDLVIS